MSGHKVCDCDWMSVRMQLRSFGLVCLSEVLCILDIRACAHRARAGCSSLAWIRCGSRERTWCSMPAAPLQACL